MIIPHGVQTWSSSPIFSIEESMVFVSIFLTPATIYMYVYRNVLKTYALHIKIYEIYKDICH